MTLDGCAPCNCVPTNIANDVFKHDVEVILCALLTSSQAIEGVLAQAVPQKTVAFGSITNAFVNQHVFDTTCDTGTFRYLKVTNNTDHSVDITFNTLAGTQVTIAAAANQVWDYGVPIVLSSGDVYMKYTSAAPTSGSVVFEGAC